MKKRLKYLFILLFSTTLCLPLAAQEVAHTLYKGKINNKAVTFYLKQEPNPCGGGTGNLYRGIYQYGTGENWIELEISSNQKGDFCMTEYGFTGVLILKKMGDSMDGVWISPDGKTQHKVAFKKMMLSAKQQEEMEDHLERTHYGNHDC